MRGISSSSSSLGIEEDADPLPALADGVGSESDTEGPVVVAGADGGGTTVVPIGAVVLVVDVVVVLVVGAAVVVAPVVVDPATVVVVDPATVVVEDTAVVVVAELVTPIVEGVVMLPQATAQKSAPAEMFVPLGLWQTTVDVKLG